MYQPSLESGDKLQAINDIGDEVYTTTADYNSSLVPATDRTAAGILENASVLVTRGGPGQPVYNNY